MVSGDGESKEGGKEGGKKVRTRGEKEEVNQLVSNLDNYGGRGS